MMLSTPAPRRRGSRGQTSKAPRLPPGRPAPNCGKGPPRISRSSCCCSHGGGSGDRLLLVWLLAGAHRRAPREMLDPAGKPPQGRSAALCLCLWPPRSPRVMAGYSFLPLCLPRTSSGHVCGTSSAPGTRLRGPHQLPGLGCGQERSCSELRPREGCTDRCSSLLPPSLPPLRPRRPSRAGRTAAGEAREPRPSPGSIFHPLQKRSKGSHSDQQHRSPLSGT